MASRRWYRVSVFTLALTLLALPALAGTRLAGQSETSLFDALVRAFAKLVPAAAGVADGLLPEAGAPSAAEDEPGPESDLGSGLDPLG
jgi:hypothetical protein